MIEKLTTLLGIHEGVETEAYYCPSGYLTIGVGHNCEARPVPGVTKGRFGDHAPEGTPPDQRGDKITISHLKKLFLEDVNSAAKQLDIELPFWRKLNEPRRAVYVDMTFNMGIGGFKTFKKMHANAQQAIENNDWNSVVAEMLDSKWADEVSEDRVNRLTTMMETGEWPF